MRHRGDPRFVEAFTAKIQRMAPGVEKRVPVRLHHGPYDGLILSVGVAEFAKVCRGGLAICMPMNSADTLVACYKLRGGPVAAAAADFVDYAANGSGGDDEGS